MKHLLWLLLLLPLTAWAQALTGNRIDGLSMPSSSSIECGVGYHMNPDIDTQCIRTTKIAPVLLRALDICETNIELQTSGLLLPNGEPAGKAGVTIWREGYESCKVIEPRVSKMVNDEIAAAKIGAEKAREKAAREAAAKDQAALNAALKALGAKP